VNGLESLRLWNLGMAVTDPVACKSRTDVGDGFLQYLGRAKDIDLFWRFQPLGLPARERVASSLVWALNLLCVFIGLPLRTEKA